ncbi:MAG: hypothetical protein ABSA13_11740 [Beijerinckiaceae bacterium]|jgi:hypothetical protein
MDFSNTLKRVFTWTIDNTGREPIPTQDDLYNDVNSFFTTSVNNEINSGHNVINAVRIPFMQPPVPVILIDEMVHALHIEGRFIYRKAASSYLDPYQPGVTSEDYDRCLLLR